MSEKITIFKQQLFKEKIMNFFKFSPDNLLIVLYKLIKVSSLYLNTFRDITFAKLQSTKFKKGNNSKSIICCF